MWTGGRVAVMTNAKDPGVLAVTACTARGVTRDATVEPPLDRLAAVSIPLISSQGVVDLRPRHQEWLVQQDQAA